MAIPIHGDEGLDCQMMGLTERMQLATDHKFLKNGSLKVLKEMALAAEHLAADIRYTITEKIEQKIGGVKGTFGG